MLLVAALLASAAAIRTWFASIPLAQLWMLATVIAAQPIALKQLTGAYVDGGLVLLLTILGALLAVYLRTPSHRLLLYKIGISAFAVNTKLTATVFVPAFWVFAIFAKWIRCEPPHRRLTTWAAVASIALAAALGYQPYVTNIERHGNLLHPVYGPHADTSIRDWMPASKPDATQVEPLLLQFSGRTVATGATWEHKWPWQVSSSEISALRFSDNGAGGNGPLFSLALLMALPC